MSEVNKNLGHATAYGYAKSKGYSGTEEQFAELMADYAEVAQRAEAAATSAAASATAASDSASDSAASATAAEGSASAAATSAGTASQAAQSASQSATEASGSATSAAASATAAAGSATTAGSKAIEAAQSATAAAGSATTAGASATAAQTAQTAAETAEANAEQAEANAEWYAERVERFLPTDTASGSIVSFSDGADGVPVRSVTVDIEPIQDLHGQDAPYPAGGGKNLLPTPTQETQTVNGVTVKANADGSITFSGTASSSISINFVFFDLAAGDYILSNIGSNAASSEENTTIYVRDNTNGVTLADFRLGNSVSNIVFTLTETINIRFYAVLQSGATVSGTLYPMIRRSGNGDDTYAPYSNICPISGWAEGTVWGTGKNLFGGEWMADKIVSAVNNETYASKGTDTHGDYVFVLGGAPVMDKVIFDTFKPDTRYTFILKFLKNNSNSYINLAVFYTDGTHTDLTYGSSISADTVYTAVIVTTSGKSVDRLETQFASGTAYFYYEDCGVFEGVLTADDFVPYTGASYHFDFPSTVYGGTWDAVSGTLTIDRAMVDLGTLTWVYYAPSGDIIYPYMQSSVPSDCTSQIATSLPASFIASAFRTVGSGYVGKQEYDNTIAQGRRVLFVASGLYADEASFRSALNGVQLCYELAEPQVYHLTPQEVLTLLGTNNVWSDAGEIAVTYKADVQLYIDKRISEAVSALS